MGQLGVTVASLLSILLLAEMSAAAETDLSAIPILPYLPSNSQLKKDFQVLISLQAPKELIVHEPIDLIFIHSVGNDGNLVKAVRDAIRFVRNELPAEDSLTVVGPGPEAAAAVIANEAIPAVIPRPAGTTTITFEDLVKKAYEKLGWTGRPRVIMFLSDGEGIEMQGTTYSSVHVFGLGDEHNAKALSSLATASLGGTYSFVLTKELGKISAALVVCVGGLKTGVVRGRSHLTLQPTEGVKITKIRYGAVADAPPDPTTGEVLIGKFYAGETKNIIVHLDVDDPAVVNQRDSVSGGCGDVTLLKATFYQRKSDTVGIIKTVCVQKTPPQGVLAPPSSLVLEHLVRFELIELVVKHFGPLSSRPSGQELQNLWLSFLESHKFWSGIDVILIGLEQQMDVLIKFLKSDNTSFWLAYIKAWISSYNTQRPTAIGSAKTVVNIFVTQEVNIMLQVQIHISENMHIYVGSICQPEPSCFDANELATEIVTVFKEKRWNWTPCDQKADETGSIANTAGVTATFTSQSTQVMGDSDDHE